MVARLQPSSRAAPQHRGGPPERDGPRAIRLPPSSGSHAVAGQVADRRNESARCSLWGAGWCPTGGRSTSNLVHALVGQSAPRIGWIVVVEGNGEWSWSASPARVVLRALTGGVIAGVAGERNEARAERRARDRSGSGIAVAPREHGIKKLPIIWAAWACKSRDAVVFP